MSSFWARSFVGAVHQDVDRGNEHIINIICVFPKKRMPLSVRPPEVPLEWMEKETKICQDCGMPLKALIPLLATLVITSCGDPNMEGALEWLYTTFSISSFM